MARKTATLTAIILATALGSAAFAGDEIIIYQGGEEPRSGGTVPEPVDQGDEVIIYKGGEKPRSGGTVKGVMAGPDGSGDMKVGPLPF